MTKKDLFNEWERQEPLELDKEKLGTAFSKVLKKIDSVESVMENEKAHRKSGSYVFRKVAIYSSVAAAAVICVTSRSPVCQRRPTTATFTRIFRKCR